MLHKVEFEVMRVCTVTVDDGGADLCEQQVIDIAKDLLVRDGKGTVVYHPEVSYGNIVESLYLGKEVQ